MAMNYRECAVQFVERCERLAAETGAPLEVVIKVQKAGWADEVALEQEKTTARTEVNAEREAARPQLSDVIAQCRTNGRWPPAKDLIGQVGLPPTRSHLGWLSYQLRIARSEAVQPAE